MSSASFSLSGLIRISLGLFLTPLFFVPATAQSTIPVYTFSHFAGSTGGPGSTDGSGTTARFSYPLGIASDSFGNLYLADTYNNTIRKINSAGIVSTVAGTVGVVGSADGNGAAAQFDLPSAIAIDSSGNIYVADYGNHAIRKINAAGSVTTLAGSATQSGSVDGVGTAARFINPAGIAVDSTGNVYVADIGNGSIRKIATNGAVTTIVAGADASGNGGAFGEFPFYVVAIGLAVDGAGNVYVSDFVNNVIRVVSSAGGVTTLAGGEGVAGNLNGVGTAARFSGPLGLAIDRSGNLFVADAGNTTIRQITPSGAVTNFVGPTSLTGDPSGASSALFYLSGLAIDGVGNLYLSDPYDSLVKRVSVAGTVSALAGVSAQSGSANGVGSVARFNRPAGLSFDRAGNLYLADQNNHTIRKIDTNGTATTFAGTPGLSGSVDGTTGSARFNRPSGTAIDSIGNIFVVDTGNHTIRKISTTGVVTTFAGVAGQVGSTNAGGASARFNTPQALAIDSGDNLYVSDTGNSTVRKINTAGVVSAFAGSPGLQGTTDATGSLARFISPAGLVVDSAGNVYVTDSAANTIRKIAPTGAVTTIVGGAMGSKDGTGLAAQFAQPFGLAMDLAGNLYVADTSNEIIRKVTTAGVVTTIGGFVDVAGSEDGVGTAARLNQPLALVVDGTGNLFISDAGNQAIRKASQGGVGFPSISVQPTSLLAVLGGSATFSVTATNVSSYQWFKDGAAIPGATSSTLTIAAVKAGDAGSYQVQISGASGKAQSVTVTLTIVPAGNVKLTNISTRSFVGTGDNVQIAGFIISGTQPKRVLIRANGPALAQFAIPGFLADPVLTLYSGSTQVLQNDDWGSDAANITAATTLVGATPFAASSKDSAIVTTLQPGAYTALVSGKNASTGVALIEVFEADTTATTSKLYNLSTRSQVMTGAQIQIAGLIITGTAPKKVLIRASGPALAAYGLPGYLADPVLTLYSGSNQVAQDDDWGTDAANILAVQASVGATPFATGSKDAAMVVTLQPGDYTAQVTGKSGATGIALIEVFDADGP